MPECKCGRHFPDGSALRDHLKEKHPSVAGLEDFR